MLLALLLAASPLARAADAEVAGYLRVMTRPDFQGGDGKLGYWNLYGRLLNEGPYAAFELKVDLLEREPGSDAPWTQVHTKVEGGALANAEPGNGGLAGMRLTQLYALAGNVLLRDVTWQVGTLDSWFGDLGLYDAKPAQVFYETIGASARWQRPRVELLLGAGDSGYALKGSAYNTVLTGGGSLRLRLAEGAEVGLGGTASYEPRVVGNRFAPHTTPGVAYEDFVRGEVLEAWDDANPNQLTSFPDPVPADARSWKVIGYFGWGAGPVRWSSLYFNALVHHPDPFVVETFEGQDFTVYVTDLTDERFEFNAGNELQLRLVPDRLDAVWGVLVGYHADGDNDIAPSDHDRTFGSTVLRLQGYLSPTVHLLAEGSVAREVSTNGNRYRNAADSIFQSSNGQPDTRGLEYGDADTRDTAQGKGGVVLNPLGPGVYARPSLRFLYGAQWSTQNNAFGNSFVETVDEYDDFEPVERHLHHVVALEAEAWF